MPTYHYRCANGHDFDVFERKISDKLRAKCPECGKMAQRQISGGVGFHLKGSGFYGTDYKASGGEAQDGEKKAEPGGEAKTQPTGENKSDPAGDKKPEQGGEKTKKPAKDTE